MQDKLQDKLLIDFSHTQSAHCESGAAANLMNWHGIKLSEAMTFGIGGGLFFGYFPFIRLNGLPLVTYRAAAGHILKRLSKVPGVRMFEKRFRNQEQAMA